MFDNQRGESSGRSLTSDKLNLKFLFRTFLSLKTSLNEKKT